MKTILLTPYNYILYTYVSKSAVSLFILVSASAWRWVAVSRDGDGRTQSVAPSILALCRGTQTPYCLMIRVWCTMSSSYSRVINEDFFSHTLNEFRELRSSLVRISTPIVIRSRERVRHEEVRRTSRSLAIKNNGTAVLLSLITDKTNVSITTWNTDFAEFFTKRPG